MNFKNTLFYYFHDECIKKFGREQGDRIYNLADIKLNSLIAEAQYQSSKAIKFHMNKNILPGISIYLAYKELGYTKEEAYANTLEMTQIYARKACERYKLLGKNPFGYYIFKLFCKHVIKKEYPVEGWSIEWKKHDKREIHFNMTRCIYAETTRKYNCPELCTVFCANDVTAFAGLGPNIIFAREATIGEGKELCDFHFRSGKV